MRRLVYSPRSRARICLRAGLLLASLTLVTSFTAIGRAAAQAQSGMPTGTQTGTPIGSQTGAPTLPALIPWPTSVTVNDRDRLAITKDTIIEIAPASPELRRLAAELAERLRPALEGTIAIREARGTPPDRHVIRLELTAPPSTRVANSATPPTPQDERYELTITPDAVRLAAPAPAGLFYGLQTLRQLFPPSIEHRAARPHALSLPTGRIVDQPRFAWRGAMLDVARHFFGPADLRRYIDLLALYKFNRLHLHLSDDQGWRLEVPSWPNLTAIGGRSAVNGDPGGFYTRQDWADLLAYARDRFITIVPEIDMPSHINAALSAYPELNCDGVAPPLYTGIEVGFSNFCVEKEVTWRFIDDVVREIAAVTPGPYFHIGGDEVKKLNAAQYTAFVERTQEIVRRHGKTVIGWDEVVHATLLPSTIVQYWRPDASIVPPAGTQLILSPANKVYLDMKYDDATAIGLNWAGNVDLMTAYQWNPATLLPNVPESALLGVEAPIWSETLVSMRDVEFMAFPRIAAVAEVAWSAQVSRDPAAFRARLGGQAARWSALGINANWLPGIDWRR